MTGRRLTRARTAASAHPAVSPSRAWARLSSTRQGVSSGARRAASARPRPGRREDGRPRPARRPGSGAPSACVGTSATARSSAATASSIRPSARWTLPRSFQLSKSSGSRARMRDRLPRPRRACPAGEADRRPSRLLVRAAIAVRHPRLRSRRRAPVAEEGAQHARPPRLRRSRNRFRARGGRSAGRTGAGRAGPRRPWDRRRRNRGGAIRASAIAPAHIAQGSSVTHRSQPSSRDVPSACGRRAAPPSRHGRSGSLSSRMRLRATATTAPSRITTAPTGTSPAAAAARASSSARRIGSGSGKLIRPA